MKALKDLKLQEFSKLQGLSEKDLNTEKIVSAKKLFTLTMKLRVGELKQTHLIKFLRRYIAKLNTITATK
ncbi:50S ribosomal protein L29 [Candidatus Gracilibacteria bacterium 28_42_T64]|nr:50S ribosomal protein L29 [Candidatus Gracilibacteria bacterium 28_42_T64]